MSKDNKKRKLVPYSQRIYADQEITLAEKQAEVGTNVSELVRMAIDQAYPRKKQK